MNANGSAAFFTLFDCRCPIRCLDFVLAEVQVARRDGGAHAIRRKGLGNGDQDNTVRVARGSARVRQKSAALTDPNSGELLATPGPPIGVIRVFQVSDKIARAQVLSQAGALARGDELEWLGVYVAANDK